MKPGDQVAVTILGTVVYAESSGWLGVETVSSGWLVTVPVNVAGVTIVTLPDGQHSGAELDRLWQMAREPDPPQGSCSTTPTEGVS